ncbi:MAG: hypothetical protein AB9M53_00490 [Leptothrix sp. (in: b-proteobacteria)]
MARPQSPITLVVREAVQARGAQPTTWLHVAHDLAGRGVINASAPSELQLVRRTMKNMAQRGELLPAARVPTAGSRRPMTGWVACQGTAPYRARVDGCDPMAHALSHVMQAWMA